MHTSTRCPTLLHHVHRLNLAAVCVSRFSVGNVFSAGPTSKPEFIGVGNIPEMFDEY